MNILDYARDKFTYMKQYRTLDTTNEILDYARDTFTYKKVIWNNRNNL